MKKSVLVVLVVLTFFATCLVNAQPMPMKNKRPPQGMMMHRMDLMKKLNLTEQQKDKIADLRISFQKKMVDLRADLKKNKLDLQGLKVKGDLNRDGVIAAVEKINKSRDAISLAVANHLLDVYQVLTPEQQKTWKEEAPLFKGMRQSMRRMMHNRMMN
ncbi:MAG: Spy/CpxP family protein refolding chaperone [Bacteroidetes bacterium]|nr:Spy/CpxP family protein refolding chaperone [Bacteroidota bacterium]